MPAATTMLPNTVPMTMASSLNEIKICFPDTELEEKIVYRVTQVVWHKVLLT